MKKLFAGMALSAVVCVVAACGGGSGGGGSAPVIVSLTDGADAIVSVTGTTGVFPTQFTVTFDQAMDDASVTTAGNVSATCGGNEVTLTVTATGIAGEYFIVPTDSWQAALLECTLDFSTGIKNAGGTAMASAATYTFTNACAISDDFNAQSISDEANSCWKILPMDYPTWASMIGIMSFDIPNSTLNANFTGIAEGGTAFYKMVTVSSDVVGEVHIKSLDNMNAGSAVRYFLASGFGETATTLMVGMVVDSESTLCVGYALINGANYTYSAPCVDGSDYYIRFTLSGTTLQTPQYRKASESAYTDMTPEGGSVPPIVFGTGEIYFALAYDGNPPGGELMDVDSVFISGVPLPGQY